MTRDQVIRSIADTLEDEWVVCNLGHPSQELFRTGDRDRNFYMLGSMGMALPIGLGLAMSRPDGRVIVLEGDGSLLMNLGGLASLALLRPRNLALVVLDNGSYGSTGYQATATRQAAHLGEIAKACGNQQVETVNPDRVPETIRSFRERGGPMVVHVPLERGHPTLAPIPLAPERIKVRFMEAIGAGRDPVG